MSHGFRKDDARIDRRAERRPQPTGRCSNPPHTVTKHPSGLLGFKVPTLPTQRHPQGTVANHLMRLVAGQVPVRLLAVAAVRLTAFRTMGSVVRTPAATSIHPTRALLWERRRAKQALDTPVAGGGGGRVGGGDEGDDGGGGPERSDGRRVALCVEGGAMRGAVTAGACAAILDLELESSIDVVYGCSAGAMTAAYYIAGQRDAFRIYSDILPLSGTRFLKKEWNLAQALLTGSAAQDDPVLNLVSLPFNATPPHPTPPHPTPPELPLRRHHA